MGTDEDPGIIPRFCEELFSRIEEKPSAAEVSYKVELSYFEIFFGHRGFLPLCMA